MEKINKPNKEKNKFVKFLITLKKSWYIILACILCFGIAGYFVGRKKINQNSLFSNKNDYVVLKSNIIISDGNFQDFNQSFNNTCLYFMKSNSVLKETLSPFDKNINENELKKIISFNTLTDISNMVEISIKYKTKEETKQLLDNYIENVTVYLNKTLKKNMNEDGSFKESVTESNKIKISQIGNIEYIVYDNSLGNSNQNIVKYTVLGIILGLIVALLIVYFAKFYFIIHNPYDVIKNFKLNFIAKFEKKNELLKYTKNNNYIFCCDNKLIEIENCYTLNVLIENNSVSSCEIIIIIREDVDKSFFIEKAQLLFKDRIKGFIIYNQDKKEKC